VRVCVCGQAALAQREAATAKGMEELHMFRAKALREADTAVSNRRLEVEAEERRLAAEATLARERHEAERRQLTEKATKLASEAAAAAAAVDKAAALEHEVMALNRQLEAQTQVAQELAVQVHVHISQRVSPPGFLPGAKKAVEFAKDGQNGTRDVS
jgi:hypothetical protein